MFGHPRPKKSLLPPPPKRRKTNSAIEEINFDFDARADYLTGFHKRKVQRARQAQEEAIKKAKEERLAARKQLREERRQELEAHVEAVNVILKESEIPVVDGSDKLADEAWGGTSDENSPEAIDHEAEYIDEDRYITVTVEAVDVSKEGLHKVMEEGTGDEATESQEIPIATTEVKVETGKKIWPKKTRKKKFRYETKAERKVTRGKQKAGNKIKADARRGKS